MFSRPSAGMDIYEENNSNSQGLYCNLRPDHKG